MQNCMIVMEVSVMDDNDADDENKADDEANDEATERQR